MRGSLLFVLLIFSVLTGKSQKLSLAGNWQVALGSIEDKEQPVQLPGTLDDAGIGEPVTISSTLDIATLAHLQRKVQYVGKAFYKKEIVIPAGWKGKNIRLNLERVLWRSNIYIDGKLLPVTEESLSTAHQFDLTSHLKPGTRHQLVVCIDNSNIYPGINIYASQYPSKESVEMAHAYTNHTQIKWNGILGEISLEARTAVHLQQVVLTPDFASKKINIQYHLENPQRKNVRISSYITGNNYRKDLVSGAPTAAATFTSSAAIPEALRHWSEFSAKYYSLVSVVSSEQGNDTLTTVLGLRDLRVRNGNIFIDDSRIFLRGNLECIIFPLKGYTPTTEAEWRELFVKAKSYGLNSFRFHSWCPPESAFTAADNTGFYLQVELPHWNLKVGADMNAFRFLEKEADRILAAYGNHPSFLFFSMGNELEGDFSKLNALVADLKKKDRRHLYSTTTFTFQQKITGNPQPQDDFYVTQWTKKGWVRGQGVFNTETPNFSRDYSASVQGLNIPIISHEIGQYSVYPDISEIKEYTGNLRPSNFIAIRNDLEKKGLLSLAPSFLAASGKLASLLYKEETERAMKTKDMDGFQLLQLQDFPGQGTALVGLVNAFWKTKGFITPEKFKSFNSEVTPLLRFPKAVYTNNEIFTADVELANFYTDINVPISWQIHDQQNKLISSGSFPKKEYPVDNGIRVGKINYKLNELSQASKLTISVFVPGTPYRNEWNIWVYPEKVAEETGEVIITSSLAAANTALEAGKKVLLCPLPDTLRGVAGSFVPVFWSPVHFPDRAGTMGLLIQDKHQSLDDFPTDFHTDWQWWDLVIRSKAVQVPLLPESAVIVRAIDNFVSNRNLVNVFESRVGNGKLIFCSMDIFSQLEKRPQARQLRASLVKYMNTTSFNPQATLSKEILSNLFK